MSTTNKVKAVSDRLRPEMVHAMRVGFANSGPTSKGLVARRLACPGSRAHDLRFTPMGRQWASMLCMMARVHATLYAARELLQSEHFDRKAQADVESALAGCMTAIRPVVWP